MKVNFKRNLAVVMVGLMGAAAAMAQTAPSDPSAAITSAQTTILGYVATFGAAVVAIALAKVGWVAGASLIKRLRP